MHNNKHSTARDKIFKIKTTTSGTCINTDKEPSKRNKTIETSIGVIWRMRKIDNNSTLNENKERVTTVFMINPRR